MVRGENGISRLAVPVALVVILVVASAYVFLTRSPTTSTQSSSGASSSVPVQTAVNQFVQDLNDRNVAGLVTFYSPTAVVRWSGNTGGLSGLYSGTGDIRLIYATSVGKTTQMNVNASNYVEKVFSPTHLNATFDLLMLANSSEVGILNATINVSQEWNWGSAGWQISRENWSYAIFDSSYIDLHNPHISTTFPQWGVMKMGGNPNLVSEKSFEWHVGPYVAAAVYAFLFGIVFITAMRLRSRDGGGRAARPS